jgi:hypothetical protein
MRGAATGRVAVVEACVGCRPELSEALWVLTVAFILLWWRLMEVRREGLEELEMAEN